MDVSISIPIAEVSPDVHAQRQFTFSLSGAQAQALKALAQGLEQSGATLQDGSTIRSSDRAMRWLAEQVGEAIGRQTLIVEPMA